MERTSGNFASFVTALVPSLSKSLEEQFNVLTVMHHGTHEKQRSNIFAWLLDSQGTHKLEDRFQRIFIAQLNSKMPSGVQLPSHNYLVTTEVNTLADGKKGGDIADIVLTSDTARVVIENYDISDGHGHSYHGYLNFGTEGGRQGVVVLLCETYQQHRQTQGWEQAIVITYAELLDELKRVIAKDKTWLCAHPSQNFFITQLFEHYVEGPKVMDTNQTLAFLKAMSETGESQRYGKNNEKGEDTQAEEFAQILAQHARNQFVQGREVLSTIKTNLKSFIDKQLLHQINQTLGEKIVTGTKVPSGLHQWYVRLEGDSEKYFDGMVAGLIFGPSAAEYNLKYTTPPIESPDFGKVFVRVLTGELRKGNLLGLLFETDVDLAEVYAGLASDDYRLRDAVLRAIGRETS